MGRCYNGNVWIRLTSKMMIIVELNMGIQAPVSCQCQDENMRFSTIKFGCTLIQTNPNGCVWKCCVPHCTQWFCWSLSLLNGYFIGNIPYFQTNPNTHQNLEILEIQVEHRIDKASQHFTAIVSPSVSTFLRATFDVVARSKVSFVD